jgi:ubiquinone/menaquinone biosynthesis C-methylase UbiE
MKPVIWPAPIYEFFRLIHSSPLEKRILDCGAGGIRPPLTFFAQQGYAAYGIDISEQTLQQAQNYATEQGVTLRLQPGDMRKIPFEDQSFSFVYTYESLCHLSKTDQQDVIAEMHRILRPQGYLLVDFMSQHCSYYGDPSLGHEIQPGEFQSTDDEGNPVLHTFFTDTEADPYFTHFTLHRKEHKTTHTYTTPQPITHGRIYYYLQKPKP